MGLTFEDRKFYSLEEVLRNIPKDKFATHWLYFIYKGKAAIISFSAVQIESILAIEELRTSRWICAIGGDRVEFSKTGKVEIHKYFAVREDNNPPFYRYVGELLRQYGGAA